VTGAGRCCWAALPDPADSGKVILVRPSKGGDSPKGPEGRAFIGLAVAKAVGGGGWPVDQLWPQPAAKGRARRSMVRLEQAKGGAGLGVGCGWFLNGVGQGACPRRGSLGSSSHPGRCVPSLRVLALSAGSMAPCPLALPAPGRRSPSCSSSAATALCLEARGKCEGQTEPPSVLALPAGAWEAWKAATAGAWPCSLAGTLAPCARPCSCCR